MGVVSGGVVGLVSSGGVVGVVGFSVACGEVGLGSVGVVSSVGPAGQPVLFPEESVPTESDASVALDVESCRSPSGQVPEVPFPGSV